MDPLAELRDTLGLGSSVGHDLRFVVGGEHFLEPAEDCDVFFDATSSPNQIKRTL